MEGTVVIVGAGQAGFETATSLRSKGYPGAVTLLGDEPGVPYQRPPLSKAFLKSAPDPDSVALRPLSYFSDHRIEVRSDEPVVALDRHSRTVTLGSGEQVSYSHLVLATGTRNRLLPVSGADLPGVHYLRTLAEACALASALAKCASVVVVGAGFIGLEVAAAARSAGAEVTVVESLDRPMARAVSGATSKYFFGLHERHGIRMLLGSGVREIVDRDGRAAGVITTDDDIIDADIVVVGIGVFPNSELAERAGLPVDDGIVVDQHLLTADPNISAIGDCASYPNIFGAGRLRLESIQNAVDHARTVADRLTGNAAPYRGIPWFWTEQFDAKLQMAGLVTGHDSCVLRGSPDDGAFSVFCFADDRLLGVESVNKTRDHMAARKLLAKRCAVTREQVADIDCDLRTLVR